MSHDFRLPRGARLRLGAQYKALRDHGISTRGSLFRLSVLRVKVENTCLPQPSRPPCHDQHKISELTDFIQCGFIVSKRVGNAIVRNRIKRCLRELYRTTRPHLHSPLLIACIATPQAATASFAELRAEWNRLGKKLALF
jgi:ribonuclease P protein component